MKKIILFCILFLIWFNAFTQNYQSVVSNRDYYYCLKNKNSGVIAIHVDTIKFLQSDSIFHFYNILREYWDENSNNECFTPNGSSWFGREVIIKQNGENVFFNKDSDELIFKTNAKLNDSWTFLTLPNNQYIECTVTSINLENIINEVLDSVKTFSFLLKDNIGNIVPSNIQDFQLKLSKNYGFSQVFNFYDLIDGYTFNNIFKFSDIFQYSLVGITNPDFGIKKFSVMETYNFEIGQEFHTEYIEGGESYYMNEYSFDTTKIWQIKKVTGKQEFSDHFAYKYDICQKKIINKNGNITIRRLKDTISESIYFSDNIYTEYIELYPFETRASECIFQGATLTSDGNKRIHNAEPVCLDWHYSQYYVYMLDAGSLINEFIKGFGGPYYEDYPFFSDIEIFKLLYGKNGNLTIGNNPLDCEMLLYEPDNEFNVYPNPSNDLIFIDGINNLENCYFEILSIDGKKIKFGEIKRDISIDVSDIKIKGIYILKIHENEHVYFAKIAIN